MLNNLWNQIVDWFQDRKDRNDIVREFNNAARDSFIAGIVPTMLKASISKGDPNYRHSFSWSGRSGFRVEAMSGHSLNKDEVMMIGATILSQDVLVRKLVAYGWDTLEVHGSQDYYGCKWQLREFLAIGY